MKLKHTTYKNLAHHAERFLQIAANLAATLSAAAWALAFVIEISPWFVAGTAFVGLAAALVLLHIGAKQRHDLEQLMLATVKRLHANAEETWQAIHAGQQPLSEELAALAAAHRTVAQFIGHSTQEWDTFLDELVARPKRRQ